MKNLPAPIHLVFGADGLRKAVMARSYLFPTKPFYAVWDAHDVSASQKAEGEFVDWLRMRQPIDEIKAPVKSVLIIHDPHLFRHHIEWDQVHRREGFVLLSSQAMLVMKAMLAGQSPMRVLNAISFVRKVDQKTLSELLASEMRVMQEVFDHCQELAKFAKALRG